MGRITNFTQAQTEKIQIDEGIVYVDFGEETEMLLGPTRGGAEFNTDVKVRDIEFDGRKGKTKGLQAIEELNAVLKVVSLCCSQESLELAFVDGKMDTATKKISSGDTGMIPVTKYRKNITVFGGTLDGKFKKITIYNPLHEGSFSFKSKPKAENEHSLEFNAHWDPFAEKQLLYEVDDVENIPTV